MAYSQLQGDNRFNRVHNVAICSEIGERLRSSLDGKLTELPPHLLTLMTSLHAEFDGDQAAPSE
jgi:hypothetical protein